MTKAGFRLLLVLAAFFAADAGWTHSDMDKPLYVATAGVDEGRCQDPANPCRTLAYALNRVGKGGQVRVAGGTYQLSDAAAIFQVISGITDIRGGFAADNQFLAPAGLPTLITGMPYQYRAQVQSLGFHLVADQKGTNSNTLKETRAMLKQNQALQAGLPAAACIGGSVSGLSCQNTDLLAHVPFSAVSGNPGAAADIWGFVDLNTNREYALVSYNNGTAVFDVTDPTEPAEIGFVAGQNTVWRDIKVYQYFDETDQRWHAFAYVTADGTSEG
ncbi:MAG: choice-of-anchor B family protein, partial [Woeseiaceae bacterium]|nr:choice-of-anchor B family protein [Woeseiaceae bacterium]